VDRPTPPAGAWNYERLYETVSAYALDRDRPAPSPLLFQALARRQDTQIEGMTDKEWLWLQWNLGYLRRIVNRKLTAGLIYVVHRSRWHSFYTRDIARRTGEPETSVNRWALSLMAKSLLARRRLPNESRSYYVADPSLGTIHRLCLDLALRRYSERELEEYTTPDSDKAARLEVRKLAIRTYQRTHYRKTRGPPATF
jgi:hypothetical protein